MDNLKLNIRKTNKNVVNISVDLPERTETTLHHFSSPSVQIEYLQFT